MSKKIDIKEFRETGYLQELNRKFLHPLGMALVVRINKDGSEALDSIIDARDDKEGFIYGVDNLPPADVIEMRKKRDEVAEIWDKMAANRTKSLGYVIEPIT